MDITVLVEPVANHGYRAQCSAPLHLEAEGASGDDAIRKLRELIDRRLAAGGEIVTLHVGTLQHPLARFAGMFKDDPLLGPWKAEMEAYRQQAEIPGSP
jgi:hypothetical protein